MKIIVVGILCLMSAQAFAVCHERFYTADHLKRHPKQEVRNIHFGQYFEAGTQYFELHIDLIRNNKKILARAHGTCEGTFVGSAEPGRCSFGNNQGTLIYKYEDDGVSALIELSSGAQFENVSRNANPGAQVSISDYDSSMRVINEPMASLYHQSCEEPLARALHLSTPRLWNELILHSIRNDVARPTVTARNLYHMSALLWDIHAAFEPNQKSLFVSESFESQNPNSRVDRDIAMAYGAHHFLKTRFHLAPANAGDLYPADFPDEVEDRYLDRFYDRLMAKLEYPIEPTPNWSGYKAAKLGQRMAESLLAQVKNDGSNEAENYKALASYPLINTQILDISQSRMCSMKVPSDQMIDDFYEHYTSGEGAPGPFDISPYLGEDFAESINIDHWVRLNIPGSIDQGGNAQASEQSPLTLFWGSLPTFGELSEDLSPTKPGVYFDPGDQLPRFSENPEAVIRNNLQVVEFSALLSPVDTTGHDFDRDGKGDFNPGSQLIDISPATLGNNPLGSNSGQGRSVNPATGKPYQPNKVKAADYYRAIAEFWADGPSSETPPGHWNTLANFVLDKMRERGQEFRWMGQGEPLNEELYSLRLYLTLNGALHDAGVVAWGIKSHYQGNRPVMVIRKLADMAEKDQAFADYLVSLSPNLKMVTYMKETPQGDGSIKKEEMRKLAVKAWRGPSEGNFFTTEVGQIELRDLSFRKRDEVALAEEEFYLNSYLAGVGWILAENWLPYQRRTFVTPPFPGFVSGHSTFSRAAAEVLTHVTGNEYFPGGIAVYPAPDLEFEYDEAEPFNFEWATYYDAADVSGISRIYGGIHASYDDLPARDIGSKVGKRAVERAKELF